MLATLAFPDFCEEVPWHAIDAIGFAEAFSTILDLASQAESGALLKEEPFFGAVWLALVEVANEVSIAFIACFGQPVGHIELRAFGVARSFQKEVPF
jgi:hypothetical protein